LQDVFNIENPDKGTGQSEGEIKENIKSLLLYFSINILIAPSQIVVYV
jgi:hypothetical protein